LELPADIKNVLRKTDEAKRMMKLKMILIMLTPIVLALSGGCGLDRGVTITVEERQADEFVVNGKMYTAEGLKNYFANLQKTDTVLYLCTDKRKDHLKQYKQELSEILSDREIGFEIVNKPGRGSVD